MANFLNYLEKFEENTVVERTRPSKNIITVEKKVNKKSLNVSTIVDAILKDEELRELIESFIDKKLKDNKVIKESKTNKQFVINPKKVVKNKAVNVQNRAIDILDGLPDEPNYEMITSQVQFSEQAIQQTNASMSVMMPQPIDIPPDVPDHIRQEMLQNFQTNAQNIPQNVNMNSVKGHATALL